MIIQSSINHLPSVLECGTVYLQVDQNDKVPTPTKGIT